MKPSEFRKIYLASVFLYGVLDSALLYKIMRHYRLKVTKEQLLKDLATRVGKKTNNYYVAKIRKDSYFLVDTIFSNDELYELLLAKEGKPVYIPKTYEMFLKYSNVHYADENKEAAFSKITSFLKKIDKRDEQIIAIIADILIDKLVYYGFQNALNSFETMQIKFSDEKELEQFIAILSECSNNLRMPSNNGFTPKELAEANGPIDPSKIRLKIGKNMRNSFLNGELDPYEYLKALEDDDELPKDVRDYLIDEIKDIIGEINHFAKA